MQMDKLIPVRSKGAFLKTIFLAKTTILTLKVVRNDPRGFSVNVRGPFKLAVYKFPNHSETVIDAEWAGTQESNSHMHCCWTEVRFAQLSQTNQAVQSSIGYKWQLSFYASEQHTQDVKNDRRLFWFYLETEHQKAVQKLKEGEVVAVA
jgi:hypothetical protein